MDFSEAMFIVFPVSSALRGFRLSSSCCSDWFNAGVPDSETVEHGAWGYVLTPLALQHEIVMKRLFSLEKRVRSAAKTPNSAHFLTVHFWILSMSL